MRPIVHGLQQQYSHQVDFLHLDVQDPRTVAAKERLGFVATPHFLLLAADGQVLQRWQGVQESKELSNALRVVGRASR
jgi:thioredoxin-like negative regulator of GroEL